MAFANSRDLTDTQWKILDTLIPEPERREDRRGRPWKDRRAVLNEFCGYRGRALHGQTFPSVIRLTRLAIADSNDGSALE